MELIPVTLYQLNNSIKKSIENLFSEPIWVIAEIGEQKINQNGHCYLELVENEEEGNIISKAKAIIWAYTFRILKPYFETSTGQSFTTGIKVLLKVYVEYHELYGLSLNVQDIEPSFTIGELQKQRLETIKKIEEDGVINMNKELSIPVSIQNIAIISSKTAAGYEDFLNQLYNNEYGYSFNCKLFSAIMQGKDAVNSINKALDEVFKNENFFDIVVLIRGGGAQLDLNCFDDYWLAYHITQFPLPVFTGIGHTKDNTVVDLVANTNFKTPTAVAEFIIKYNANYEFEIQELVSEIITISQNKIQNWNNNIQYISNQIHQKVLKQLSETNEQFILIKERLKYASSVVIRNNEIVLNNEINTWKRKIDKYLDNRKNILLMCREQFKSGIKSQLNNIKSKLKRIEEQINYFNPENILKLGYSLSIKEGKIIKSIEDINNDEIILTKIKDGSFNSKVLDKKNYNK